MELNFLLVSVEANVLGFFYCVVDDILWVADLQLMQWNFILALQATGEDFS